MMRLEVAVDDPAGLRAAVEGGADRIELCSALDVGGLTPSAGLMRLAAGCGLPVLAMIRPRSGGFCYDGDELAVMASAMVLVHSQYETRRLFMALESARKEAKRLEVDRDRLQVERRAQATPLRVEQIARQQLQMRAASPAITQYVSIKDTAPAGLEARP